MALIAHPVLLPDQSEHTLLTAWVTTNAQNLTRLLSEEGFERAKFFYTKVLSSRPGVLQVDSTYTEQTVVKLSQGNSFSVVSGLRSTSLLTQQELWVGIKWEPQEEPKTLWVLTLDTEELTQPWLLLTQPEVTKEEKQSEKKAATPPVRKPRKKKVAESEFTEVK